MDCVSNMVNISVKDLRELNVLKSSQSTKTCQHSISWLWWSFPPSSSENYVTLFSHDRGRDLRNTGILVWINMAGCPIFYHFSLAYQNPNELSGRDILADQLWNSNVWIFAKCILYYLSSLLPQRNNSWT